MVTPTKAKIEQSGDLAVMRFEGDITSTSEDAVLGSYNALPADTKKVLLDFSKVPYWWDRSPNLFWVQQLVKRQSQFIQWY